jgi:hypothetical protein
MRERLAVAIACAVLACGHPAPTPQPAPPSRTQASPDAPPAPTKVGVGLSVTPPDAEVLIDGVSYGKASRLDAVVELKPGLHTLMVTHEGYASYRAEFSVEDKTETFVVRLEQH